MPNHLKNENSPYLLQHAENPVDWYPYSPEAIEKARMEDKPIFLSIGYAACHWCHVMERESFIDVETANLMNQYFINIKVDREERPDIDSIYMRATVALTGSGGWPMSVFLTPNLEPFYAGTYFPSEPRYGMPSFKDLLYSMGMAWIERKDEVINIGRQNRAHLSGELNASRPMRTALQSNLPDAKIDLNGTIQTAFNNLIQSHDDIRGGWGGAPKFPQPMVLDFILRQIAANPTKETIAVQKVATSLRAMARGGMFDLLGGGFCRYSVDADWLVPHFEKMLYDNAQLALVYLHAYLLTHDPDFERICRATLDFILAELTDSCGGFYSSLDADSEGIEGKYYTWDYDEIAALVGEDLDFFKAACVIEPTGNFEGKIILRRSMSDESLATLFKHRPEQCRARLDQIFHKLKEVRSKRIRPTTDDKVLVMWNALAIRAFAEASRYLQEPKYTQAAAKAANHILREMNQDGELKRSWRAGTSKHTAYLEDHAAFAWALTALYQTDPDPKWYLEAIKRVEVCIDEFSDPAGGFFDTHQNASDLLLRPKDTQDNAVPCGNSLAACALMELSAFGDHPDWQGIAENMIADMAEVAGRYPTGFGQWLIAAHFANSPYRQLALVNPENQSFVPPAGLWAQWRPNLTVAINQGGQPVEVPSILRDRPVLDGKLTAYLCENFVCALPTTNLNFLDDKM